MRKLLSANFARLWKSKIFWLLELGALGFGILCYILVYVNTSGLGMNWLLTKAPLYLFFAPIYLGLLVSIFSGMFWGTEYADGTIRNKLAVGHSRRDIYLSIWFVNIVVTIIFLFSHYLAAVIIGIPMVGTEVLTFVDGLGLKIICTLIIALAYASIFTITTMLDSNKARCAVINLLLALVLLVVSIMLYSALEQPELKSQMVLQDDGSYLLQENIPNTLYVDGNLRIFYQIVEAMMPAAFALRIATTDFSAYHVAGCIGLAVLLTVLGIILFKKKDIK